MPSHPGNIERFLPLLLAMFRTDGASTPYRIWLRGELLALTVPPPTDGLTDWALP